MDVELISETLNSVSDAQQAKRASRQIQTLRGVRGVPHGDVARVASAAYERHRPTLDDEDDLRRLFMSSFEDGLVALGLLATLVPEHPAQVFDIGQSWLSLVDDVETADTLGWFILGPCFAATGGDPERLLALIEPHKKGHPAVRRALAAMGLAFLPHPLLGPAAAPLRAKLGMKEIQFVDTALSPLVHTLAKAFLRDESPPVRKCLRRLLRIWTKADPEAVVAWEEAVRGGVPKFLSEETRKARNKVKRA